MRIQLLALRRLKCKPLISENNFLNLKLKRHILPGIDQYCSFIRQYTGGKMGVQYNNVLANLVTKSLNLWVWFVLHNKILANSGLSLHLHIHLPSHIFPLGFHTIIFTHFLPSHICCMPCQSHSLFKFLTVQFLASLLLCRLSCIHILSSASRFHIPLAYILPITFDTKSLKHTKLRTKCQLHLF
jgi:hypothetical protein